MEWKSDSTGHPHVVAWATIITLWQYHTELYHNIGLDSARSTGRLSKRGSRIFTTPWSKLNYASATLLYAWTSAGLFSELHFESTDVWSARIRAVLPSLNFHIQGYCLWMDIPAVCISLSYSSTWSGKCGIVCGGVHRGSNCPYRYLCLSPTHRCVDLVTIQYNVHVPEKEKQYNKTWRFHSECIPCMAYWTTTHHV